MAAEVLFQTYNGPAPTTAAQVAQPTGTTIRTMLQLAASATKGFYITEWGISFNGSAAAAGIQVELFGTTVAATLTTALSAADVVKFSDPAGDVSQIQYGTALSAFASAAGTEGTVANCRMIDVQEIQPTNQYVKQFPLGREPKILAGQFLRVRVTAAASVGAYIYVQWGE